MPGRRHFGIGYAPDGWQSLQKVVKQLRRQGLLEVGWSSENDPGPPPDRFRDRIMFPIRDSRGDLRFLWRAHSRRGASQIPQLPGPLFEKGRELYGLFRPASRFAPATRSSSSRLYERGGWPLALLIAIATHGNHRHPHPEALPTPIAWCSADGDATPARLAPGWGRRWSPERRVKQVAFCSTRPRPRHLCARVRRRRDSDTNHRRRSPNSCSTAGRRRRPEQRRRIRPLIRRPNPGAAHWRRRAQTAGAERPSQNAAPSTNAN